MHHDVGDQRTVVLPGMLSVRTAVAVQPRPRRYANDIDPASKIIAGTARSMGMTVE